ncbi:MAG: hypothetical protein ACI8PG_004915, partial [Planctomycetota bacterium]
MPKKKLIDLNSDQLKKHIFRLVLEVTVIKGEIT